MGGPTNINRQFRKEKTMLLEGNIKEKELELHALDNGDLFIWRDDPKNDINFVKIKAGNGYMNLRDNWYHSMDEECETKLVHVVTEYYILIKV
jgi:hypothetical protein